MTFSNNLETMFKGIDYLNILINKIFKKWKEL